MDAADSSERFVSAPAMRCSAAGEDAPAHPRAHGLRALLDVLVRLVGVRDGGVVPFVVLPLVGLLVGLILITAGCGLPS